MNELPFFTIDWQDDHIVMIDQRLLPSQEVYVRIYTVGELCEAITTMVIRGAPALGVAGALGMALGARAQSTTAMPEFQTNMRRIGEEIGKTRPTAVNLFWAISRMQQTCESHAHLSVPDLKDRLTQEALAILADDIDTNARLGQHGSTLIATDDTVLTHCNAGALACARRGSALGVLYAAWENGTRFRVVADETRPVLQGARLTAWELQKFGIPTTLITDNMAASLMGSGLITKVIVGADRIAANGDVANKIGTYGVAILAKYHDIPFYVAAPKSTIDPKITSGKDIPIEERKAEEVTHIQGVQLAPQGIGVRNPAFDVTPASLVSAIITEDGIHRAPYAFR